MSGWDGGTLGEVKHFTLVFEGELSVLPTNPHKTETPFGFPVAAGIGDAFAKLDAIETSHARLIEALEAAKHLCANINEFGHVTDQEFHDYAEAQIDTCLTQVREGGE